MPGKKSDNVNEGKSGRADSGSSFRAGQLDELLRGVEAAVRSVGSFVRKRAGAANLRIDAKGMNNFVTEVDTWAERRLVSALNKLLPDAAFLTEEGTTAAQAGRSELQWIVDPIDGTTNFIHGLPCYAVSVALRQGARELLGVVYEISRDECFSARAGARATLNGKPIRVSKCPVLDQALVATGFPYEDFDWMPRYMNVMGEVMQKSQGLRRWGSAAVDLAYVACGRFDAFFEYRLNPWDVAAGVLIVRQAGGSVSTFSDQGDPVFDRQIVAACTAQVGEELRVLVAHGMDPGRA